jgi:hypothetical protein
MTVGDEVARREELEAAIAARKELGAELEPEVIDAFIDRIDRRLSERAWERERTLKRRKDHQKEMTLGGMALSIPLLAIAANYAGIIGVIAVCAALAVIAVVSGRD